MSNMEANLGPMVIGQKKFEALQAIKEVGADRLGPLVTGKVAPPQDPIEAAEEQADEAAEAAGTDGGQYAVREIAPLLADNPESLDHLVALEEARALPRVGALRAFAAAVTPATDAALVARIDALEARV